MKTKTAKKHFGNVIQLPSYASAYRRTAHDPDLGEALHCMEQSGLSVKGVAFRTGISESCLRNWMRGKTKRPQNITISFVLRACGFERRIVRIKS